MSDDDLLFTPASELARLIRARALSPVELTRAVLERAYHTQATLNAFITIADEQAMATAKAAEQAVIDGDALGPLHGVPFTVKDLIDTAGVRTTYGSLILEHNVPRADGPAVARMKAAGAIMVGKVTTPEFGHKPMNEAPLFGRTHNPWDLSRTPGGSSGGSAAAVAAGIAPLSIGTDAGGSIRIPAACCGIVGMKATLGCIPHDTAPDTFGNFSNQGPMTRTVMDSALMMAAMAGPHPADVHAHGLPEIDFVGAAAGEGDLSGLRIAYRPLMGNRLVDPQILAATEDAVAVLEGLGARVERVNEDFENTEPSWLVITQSLWVARFEQWLDTWRDRMTPTLVQGIDEGRGYSAVDLQRAIVFRTRLFRMVQSWFEDYDLLITPTLARTALDVDHDFQAPVTICGEPTGKIRQHWYPYTHPFNMTGHPAITLPAGLHADGLPMAVQLVGPLSSEALLLRAAALFERARPWAQLRPPQAW
jgi:aspartyl-tRNA(Asn)/glutamyl-tRNA(Gln) amidotransferase subunit A